MFEIRQDRGTVLDSELIKKLGFFREQFLDLPEQDQGQDDQTRENQTDEVISGADDKPQARHGPERGGRRQPVNHPARLDDRAGPDEAHAGDHAGRDAQRISGVGAFSGKHDLGQDHHHRRADADHDVRPQAGRLMAEFPLQPDQPSQDDGQDQFQYDFTHISRSLNDLIIPLLSWKRIPNSTFAPRG